MSIWWFCLDTPPPWLCHSVTSIWVCGPSYSSTVTRACLVGHPPLVFLVPMIWPLQRQGKRSHWLIFNNTGYSEFTTQSVIFFVSFHTVAANSAPPGLQTSMCSTLKHCVLFRRDRKDATYLSPVHGQASEPSSPDPLPQRLPIAHESQLSTPCVNQWVAIWVTAMLTDTSTSSQ